jgi:hypothetical protein
VGKSNLNATIKVETMKYPSFSKRASLKVVNSQRQLEKAAEEPDAEEFLRRFKEHADASIENAYQYVANVSCDDRSR